LKEVEMLKFKTDQATGLTYFDRARERKE